MYNSPNNVDMDLWLPLSSRREGMLRVRVEGRLPRGPASTTATWDKFLKSEAVRGSHIQPPGGVMKYGHSGKKSNAKVRGVSRGLLPPGYRLLLPHPRQEMPGWQAGSSSR